jgi:hypothetical protein
MEERVLAFNAELNASPGLARGIQGNRSSAIIGATRREAILPILDTAGLRKLLWNPRRIWGTFPGPKKAAVTMSAVLPLGNPPPTRYSLFS